jgi:hypothetical protein
VQGRAEVARNREQAVAADLEPFGFVARLGKTDLVDPPGTQDADPVSGGTRTRHGHPAPRAAAHDEQLDEGEQLPEFSGRAGAEDQQLAAGDDRSTEFLQHAAGRDPGIRCLREPQELHATPAESVRDRASNGCQTCAQCRQDRIKTGCRTTRQCRTVLPRSLCAAQRPCANSTSGGAQRVSRSTNVAVLLPNECRARGIPRPRRRSSPVMQAKSRRRSTRRKVREVTPKMVSPTRPKMSAAGGGSRRAGSRRCRKCPQAVCVVPGCWSRRYRRSRGSRSEADPCRAGSLGSRDGGRPGAGRAAASREGQPPRFTSGT